MYKRISAFIIDYFIIMLIASPLLITSIRSIQLENFDLFNTTNENFLAVVGLLLLLKDIIYKGSSIGKKTMGLQIVNSNSEKASKIKMVIRNFGIIIWPIEALAFLLTNSRLSDSILNLNVIEVREPNALGRTINFLVKVYVKLVIYFTVASILLMAVASIF